jgi:transcriptional regulator with XRE-family HTH domain
MLREDRNDIADTIRLRRRQLHLSQVELGKRVGMPQSQIARIERGDSDLRLSTVLELARVLGLEPMLIPKQLVPAVSYMIAPKSSGEAKAAAAPEPRLVGNAPEDADDER